MEAQETHISQPQSYRELEPTQGEPTQTDRDHYGPMSGHWSPVRPYGSGSVI